jgi:adenosylmethionine-8-amino-7-oxononanoate aminotransferase
MTINGGYHGDTFGAMGVCDPVTGMHVLFRDVLPAHHFAPRPGIRFGEPWRDDDIAGFEALLAAHAGEIAAVILEPIVQGAGGMWFYSPEYLRCVRRLCDAHDVLLIADEIATGFGRTGKLFACDHAGIAPDIMCLGKALTGGYLNLAATLASRRVAETVCAGEPGVFMHGPTFMANPLACAAALASVDLLLAAPWETAITRIATQLQTGLEPCRAMRPVADVRVLGGIGVVELHDPVDRHRIPHAFVDRGVWVRPFGRLVYLMPPYVISDDDLSRLTTAVVEVVDTLERP